MLSGLLLGMFLAALDQTTVPTAMRTIADALDGQTAQAWVTTAYLITSTTSTPLDGGLSDQYGRGPSSLFAIVVFVGGSVLFGSLAGDITARAREAGLPEEVVDRFSSASALGDSSIIATLPDAVPAFVLTLLVEESPLRAQGGLAAAQADADTEERLAARGPRARSSTRARRPPGAPAPARRPWARPPPASGR